LVATVAEVPFTVRLAIILRPFFLLIAICLTGVYVFESEWFVFHLSQTIKTVVD
jgi:hypothetical protein